MNDNLEVHFVVTLYLFQLPYYIDGELKITESSAILRHLARKNDLDGATEEQKIKIDMSVGIMCDLGRPLSMLFYNHEFVSLASFSRLFVQCAPVFQPYRTVSYQSKAICCYWNSLKLLHLMDKLKHLHLI